MKLLHWLDEAKRELHEWIDLLRDQLGWRDDDKVWAALLAVLHALRDSLPAEEAAHLGSRLPVILRGAYYDGWRLRTLQFESRQDFLERIEASLRHDLGMEPEQAAHAVFALLADRLSEADLEIVKAATPSAARGLWPD